MTADDFVALQEYLIPAIWPFIKVWIIGFLAAAILIAVLIAFLVISRELLTRV